MWDGSPPEVEAQKPRLPDDASRRRSTRSTGAASVPTTARASGTRVDDDHGIVTVLRGKKRKDEPLPRGLTPGQPIEDWVKREALLRFVRAYAGRRRDGLPRADRAARAPPARGAARRSTRSAPALSLGESYLFVQGPPGSGKTWQGARMAIALMREGKRIGVTSLSHKAIHNLLRAIQHEADRQRFTFEGVKRARDEDESETGVHEPLHRLLDRHRRLRRPGLRPRRRHGRGRCAARASTSTRPSGRSTSSSSTRPASSRSPTCSPPARAPARSSCSATRTSCPRSRRAPTPRARGCPSCSTCSASTMTVPPDRGLFLARDVAAAARAVRFTSDAVLRGPARLRRRGRAPNARRRATGRRGSPVEHEHHGQSSVEEAEAVAAAVAELVGSPFTDENGATRPLREDGHPRRRALQRPGADAALAASRAASRSAPSTSSRASRRRSSFVSMASSTAEDAPRGIGFAFDSNRFNVATSRAQCRAVLVCTPALLDADCKTVEQMRLVSAVCRFVELAGTG